MSAGTVTATGATAAAPATADPPATVGSATVDPPPWQGRPYDDGRFRGLSGRSTSGHPGAWRADGDVVVLTAAEADGLTVDGQSFGGEVRLAADPGVASAARVAYGERRLVVLVREGARGVRDFDPDA